MRTRILLVALTSVAFAAPPVPTGANMTPAQRQELLKQYNELTQPVVFKPISSRDAAALIRAESERVSAVIGPVQQDVGEALISTATRRVNVRLLFTADTPQPLKQAMRGKSVKLTASRANQSIIATKSAVLILKGNAWQVAQSRMLAVSVHSSLDTAFGEGKKP